jgi:hypothetical protein
MLVARSSETIARGRTGADGLVALRAPFGMKMAIVLARRGTDFSILEVDGLPTDAVDGAVAGAVEPRAAFVFTDRAACEPGESVRIRAWTRGLDGGLPPSSPIEIAAVRPDGEPLRAARVELGARGSAEASVAIPATAPVGIYRAEVRGVGPAGASRLLGSCSFFVEEPPAPSRGVEIDLGVHPERARSLRPGEELEVIAIGTSSGGGPAVGARALARWMIAPRTAPLAGWPGFAFGEAGDWEASWGPEETEAFLDATGRARLRVAVPGVEAALPLEMRLAASAPWPAPGRAEGLLIPIDPSPVYLGLRLEDAARRGPRSARFECVAVRPDGRLADLDAVDLQLMKVRWRAVPRRSGGRSTRHELQDDVEVAGRRRVALSGGRGGFEVELDEEGFHRVRIKDPASFAASELTFHAGKTPDGFAPGPLDRPSRLQLSFARAAVRPGDRAVLHVVSAFAGTLLLMTETDHIEGAIVRSIAAGSQDVDVLIPWRPSGPVHFAALAAGRASHGAIVPSRAFARIRAPIEPGSVRLSVTINAPPSVLAGARVRARGTVASEDGSPMRGAEVAFGLLDPRERRRGARPPDPSAFFHQDPPAAFRLEDAVSLDVSTRGPPSPAGLPADGGGGGRAAPLGPFVTGDDGTVVIEVEMPPCPGDALLFAMASMGPLAGVGERPIAIRSPLRIEARWPSFLAAGDSFEVPVEVVGGVDGVDEPGFRWSLEGLIEAPIAGEPGVIFAAHREKTPGSPAGTVFGLRARWRSGPANASLVARRGGEEASVSTRISIRPRALAERRWETGMLDASRPREWAPRQGALPGSLSYRLIVSSEPTLDLAPALHALLEIDPLTLEEWTCRALPLLHLAGLAGALLGPERVDAPRREVLHAIEAILGLQGPGGFLASVPGGSARRTPANLEAACFLAEARAAGYPVPAEPLGALLDAMESSFLGPPWRSDARAALDRARALHVLALAGKADRGALESLRARLALSELEASGTDRIETEAHLAAAFAAAGLPGEAIALLDDLLPAVTAPGARARALLVGLIALAGARVEDERISGLIDLALARRVGGTWRTLEETSLALSAIGRHAAAGRLAPRWAGASPVQSPLAEVRVGSAPPVEVGPGGFRVLGGEWPDGSIRATVSGNGALRFAWLEEWTPAEVDRKGASAGLRVARRVLDRRLEPVDLSSVRRGDLVVVEIVLALDPTTRIAAGVPARAVVTDRIAAGLEVEDLAPGELASQESLVLERAVLRRGEAVFVLSLEHATSGVHRYLSRAVFRGDFGMGPITAALLEEPCVSGASAPETLKIR